MSNQPSIKKNFFYNTLYQIFTFITPLITAPYTARVLGVEGIGIQSFVGSITTYFTLFATLGTLAYGQREIARCKDEPKTRSKTFWEILIVKAITTGVTSIAWIFVIIFGKQYTPFFIASTITVIASFFDITWFFTGIENFITTVIRNVLIRTIGIICLFIFIKSKDDLSLYIFILALSTLLGNISMWFSLPKYLCEVKLNNINIKRHFKETLVYFIPTVAVSVYTILDKAMLGFLTDNAYENGYYEQAHKLVDITKAIILSLNTVMYSRMSFLFKKGQTGEMKQRLQQSIDIIFLISMPMIMGVIGVGRTLVPFFFGKGYEKVIDLFWICMPLVLIIGISNCLGQQYLTPSGQIKKSNKVIIIGAITNFILNLIMIPKLGSYGAALASLSCELLILVLYIKMSSSQLNFKVIIKNNYKRVIAAFIMFIVVYPMNMLSCNNIVKLAAQVVIGALTYGVLLIILRDSLVVDALNEIIKKRGKE